MTRFGRAVCALLLLLLTVSCTDESNDDDPCGGGGCLAWGSGSPHPYTSTIGGTTTSLSGTIEITYDQEPTSLSCGYTTCTWDGRIITLKATLPDHWYVSDAGEPDAGEPDAGEPDAGEADASVIGSPRGWGTVDRVAVVDLGSEDASGRLVGATLVTCEDRYERLSVLANREYRCVSGGERPAHIEPITGTLANDSRTEGEESITTRTLSAVTGSGVKIELTSSTRSSPLRSYTSVDCY